MRRYLIATHGEMASGMLSTIRLLAGDRNDIDIIDAYVNSDSIIDEVKKYFSSQVDNEIIVFTDLLAGSVNREIMRYMNENVHIISGFNLPFVLEMLFYDEEMDTTFLNEKIVQAREQMVYVNMLARGEYND
ncbi:PTS system mannose-specific IIA component [Breznakia blatticola]|uniref:PTS system mannose-specific IIA component n=1 Tax=Breznakia blatticola TaxID=1754012 RepID=A0A4R7ZFJ0_9FIRM|nr:hypothetical protein [Breznakia blatticola]TDW16379.1 PTS system mannose-specific IIA component [Breznakia blatticola]